MPIMFIWRRSRCLCLTFAVIYVLIPNTKVHWDAALVGGLVGGVLFHLNNAVSVLYVSRVVSNSKIYGSLGLVPVFMVGLYLSLADPAVRRAGGLCVPEPRGVFRGEDRSRTSTSAGASSWPCG